LSVRNAVDTAFGAFLDVRASLAGTFIAVEELDLDINVDRDLDVRD
jgi:hypothetical protein